MRVALLQLEVSDEESVDARVARALALVGEHREADLVVLPELWHVGAFALDRAREHAAPLDGALLQQLRTAARESGAWLHAGSVAELDAATGRRYNTSLLLDPRGELVATYRKQYLFGWADGEPSVMSAGDEFVVAHTPLGRTGLATCYDLRFPELFRTLVDRGAAAFLIPSGWPAPRVEHWSVLLRARAIENQAWVLGCNTAGIHNGVRMAGRSAIVDPLGTVIAEAGEAQEVLRASIDPGEAPAWRTKFPALTDRRQDPTGSAR